MKARWKAATERWNVPGELLLWVDGRQVGWVMPADAPTHITTTECLCCLKPPPGARWRAISIANPDATVETFARRRCDAKRLVELHALGHGSKRVEQHPKALYYVSPAAQAVFQAFMDSLLNAELAHRAHQRAVAFVSGGGVELDTRIAVGQACFPIVLVGRRPSVTSPTTPSVPMIQVVDETR